MRPCFTIERDGVSSLSRGVIRVVVGIDRNTWALPRPV